MLLVCILVPLSSLFYLNCVTFLLWLLQPSFCSLLQTVLFDRNGGWVCVADKGKTSWSRGCRLCKRAGGSWWYSWKDWWSCSRWQTLTASCLSARCAVTPCRAEVPLFFVCPAVTSLAFSSCCFLLISFTFCTSDLVWLLLFHPFPHPLFSDRVSHVVAQ